MRDTSLLSSVAIPQASAAQIQDDGLYDLDFVRSVFGGNRPLDAATVYRGIAAGRFPRPVRPSPNSNRWVGRELKAAKEELIAAPRSPRPSPNRGSAAK
jgi:hypothetical protein